MHQAHLHDEKLFQYSTAAPPTNPSLDIRGQIHQRIDAQSNFFISTRQVMGEILSFWLMQVMKSQQLEEVGVQLASHPGGGCEGLEVFKLRSDHTSYYAVLNLSDAISGALDDQEIAAPRDLYKDPRNNLHNIRIQRSAQVFLSARIYEGLTADKAPKRSFGEREIDLGIVAREIV
ncbi:hypothetical protein BGZ95_007423, partial [Linnemannia exigua]